MTYEKQIETFNYMHQDQDFKDEIFKIFKKDFLKNQNHKVFINSKNADFFNNDKSPLHKIKKENANFWEKGSELGILADNFLCYLHNNGMSPDEITIDDWHKIFEVSFIEFFRTEANLKQLDNFKKLFEKECLGNQNWNVMTQHFGHVFYELQKQFSLLLTDKKLKEELSWNSLSFEIDLWADGYVIEYTSTKKWDEKCVKQVLNYYCSLYHITKDTDFELKGIGIFNTYTNSLFLLDMELNNSIIAELEKIDFFVNLK